jgi:predicted O-methyltransferase YrrM
MWDYVQSRCLEGSPRMTAEEVYARHINPIMCCDIAQHLPFLMQEARGSVVEIGTRGGASTSALLLGVKAHGGHVWSIDINPDCGELFKDNSDWTFIHGHSFYNAGTILTQIPLLIDVLFIDADHDYKSVYSDLSIFGQLVTKRGVILLHDTELEGAGVRQAAEEYAAKAGRALELHTGCYGLGIIRI